MAGDPPMQEEEVDTSKIQLGIFIPSQTVQRNSTKKRSKKQSARGEELETTGGQENTEESRQRTRGKRKRLDSSDGVNDRTPDQPSADERTENDTESGPTAAKSKRKRKRRKNKAKQSKVGSTAGSLMATDQQRALDYLSSWDSGSDGWTFRKKTQYWLLQNAYDKSKMPKAYFKILLRYLEPLKGNQRQLAITRAQEILSITDPSTRDSSETSSASRRMHKRARAVLKVLL